MSMPTFRQRVLRICAASSVALLTGALACAVPTEEDPDDDDFEGEGEAPSQEGEGEGEGEGIPDEEPPVVGDVDDPRDVEIPFAETVLIAPSDDVDCFRFVVTDEPVLTAFTDGGCAEDEDSIITLYNVDGDLVDANDDGGGSSCAPTRTRSVRGELYAVRQYLDRRAALLGVAHRARSTGCARRAPRRAIPSLAIAPTPCATPVRDTPVWRPRPGNLVVRRPA